MGPCSACPARQGTARQSAGLGPGRDEPEKEDHSGPGSESISISVELLRDMVLFILAEADTNT